MKNLIPSLGGKLVDAEEAVSLWPLVSLGEDSTASGLRPHRIVTRAELSRDYITIQGTVDGKPETCYSLPSGAGGWYVLGWNEKAR